MKYEVRKRVEWNGLVVEPHPTGHPDGAKVIDAADLTTADGKTLPADVVQLFVRRKCLLPVKRDTPPAAKGDA